MDKNIKSVIEFPLKKIKFKKKKNWIQNCDAFMDIIMDVAPPTLVSFYFIDTLGALILHAIKFAIGIGRCNHIHLMMIT